MEKPQLIEKVKSLTQLPQSEKDKILGWINSMPNTTSKVKPAEFKVGDVLMHPLFIHPYILLSKKSDHWVCGLITSEKSCDEILEACQSRFFPENYFTRVLFTVSQPVGSFMSPYDNRKHMLSVYKQLKEIFS